MPAPDTNCDLHYRLDEGKGKGIDSADVKVPSQPVIRKPNDRFKEVLTSHQHMLLLLGVVCCNSSELLVTGAIYKITDNARN